MKLLIWLLALVLVAFIGASWWAQMAPVEAESVSARVESIATPELRDAVIALGYPKAYLFFEMEYYALPVYREFHLRYGAYDSLLFNARTLAGMQKNVEYLKRSHAVIVIRASDLNGHAPDPPHAAGWRWLDVLSGAHTHGSRLAAHLVTSRARLSQPILDLIRTNYRLAYDVNGLRGYIPAW